MRTKINRVPRHDDGGEVPSSGNLSIFSNPIMDDIFCNMKYLFYKFIYVLFKHCCYCFVRWTIYHLSVCRKVNRQYKYNLSLQ